MVLKTYKIITRDFMSHNYFKLYKDSFDDWDLRGRVTNILIKGLEIDRANNEFVNVMLQILTSRHF